MKITLCTKLSTGVVFVADTFSSIADAETALHLMNGSNYFLVFEPFYVGAKAMILNKYTGRKTGPFVVLAVTPTGKTVTIARPDFANKEEKFKSVKEYSGKHYNDYSGFLFPV